MTVRSSADGRSEWTFATSADFPRLSERLTDLGSQLSGGEQQKGKAVLQGDRERVQDVGSYFSV